MEIDLRFRNTLIDEKTLATRYDLHFGLIPFANSIDATDLTFGNVGLGQGSSLPY